MEIEDLRVVNGPNIWSNHFKKLVVIKPRLADLDSQSIKELTQKLGNLVHTSFAGNERVQQDDHLQLIWMIAQLAVRLQPNSEKLHLNVRTMGKTSHYAVFGYEEVEAGVESAYQAISITNDLISGNVPDIEGAKKKIKELFDEAYPGPSTSAIIDAAKRRDIPVKKLAGDRYIILGQGKYQKKFEASIIETTGNISVDIAGDKDTTKQLLAEALIPVPEGFTVTDENELEEKLKGLSFPVLTKPLDGHQGQGITGNIQDAESLRKGFRLAKTYSDEVIVEQYISGNDYRFLVIGYKLVAAAKRIPAAVTGNGHSTIQQLVEEVNSDPQRGQGHEGMLTAIKLDEHTLDLLREKNLSPQSVPAKNEVVYLKQTANLSTGGMAIDVTDEVHPDNVLLAEKTAKIIGLDVCGIDIMSPDITQPVTENGGVVLEVNAAPGLRMHIAPSKGKPRNVGDPIVDLLYPKGSRSRIPIVAITGTNGKTTVTRLMSAVAAGQDYVTGFTCTDGIYINGQQVEKGDCSGPDSAAVVLYDPTVEFAVLECARGGMIRSGLAFDQCDVGIVTNVAADHLGLKDIHTLEDLAEVKSVVPRSVSVDGFAMLNASDKNVLNMRKGLRCKVGLFSIDHQNPDVKQHVIEGGIAAVMNGNQDIVILKDDHQIVVENIMNIPLTMQGKADFMIENILPVVLAAYVSGFDMYKVAATLRDFSASAEQAPGRMNLFDVNGVNVMVDYAHNPHGLQALGKMLNKIDSRKTGIIAATGDRRDEDIVDLGRVAANIYDRVVIRTDADTRGRSADEMAGLLVKGMREINPEIPYDLIPNGHDALAFAVKNAQPGEYVVSSAERVDETIDYVKQLQQKAGQG